MKPHHTTILHASSIRHIHAKKKENKNQKHKHRSKKTSASCKFDIYVNILKMKSCSAARPHLEVKVQTGHKHGVCEWTEGWGVQGSAGGFRMWVNKHTVRQTHAAGRAPTRGRCHCADSRFNERVWALCDLHIWKRDISLAWRRFSWKCFFLPLDFTQKKTNSLSKEIVLNWIKKMYKTELFSFFTFYQPPLLTFIWKQWENHFFHLGKYLKKRLRGRKNISVKKKSRKIFFSFVIWVKKKFK